MKILFGNKKLIIVVLIAMSVGVGYLISNYPKKFLDSDRLPTEFSLKNDLTINNSVFNAFSLTSNDKIIKGMTIENFYTQDGISTLETTGGIFKINFKEGIIEAGQKIGVRRPIAKIFIKDEWFRNLGQPVKKGFDYVWQNETDKSQEIIISGDSVIRIFNAKKIEVKLEFIPLHEKINNSIWEFNNKGLLALDNDGGLGIMPPSYANNEKWPKSYDNNTWVLSAEQPLPLLFISVLPPRPFDWDRSYMPIIHYSSHIQRYPTDDQIAEYSKYAKILEMHSWVWQNRHNGNDKDEKGNELPLWMDYSYLPQNGKWIPDNEKEFRRTIDTAHKYGMKIVPYISLELIRGDLDLQLEGIKKLKEEYGIDGIYIDGIFLDGYPEFSYIAARKLRELFGEDGWLTLHSTHASGYWAPFVNTYMDFLVTSEHSSFDRWTSTSYKISNSISSAWPEIPLEVKDGKEFLKKMIDNSLKFNNRVLLMTGEGGQWREWRLYFTSDEMDFVKKYYLSNLEKTKDSFSK